MNCGFSSSTPKNLTVAKTCPIGFVFVSEACDLLATVATLLSVDWISIELMGFTSRGRQRRGFLLEPGRHLV